MASLSLISPCYNEEKCIERFIQDWHAELDKGVGDFEIIIIDDASSDSTPQLLDKLKKRFIRLVVLNNARNLKYGGSLFRGIRQASKEYCLWTDSDYSHYPSDFWKLWSHRQDFDAVWGVRGFMQRDCLSRTFFTIGNVALISVFFQKVMRDPNAAFKLFKREQLLRIIDSLAPHPFMTTTKIAIRAKEMNFAVKEVPVAFLRRSTGTGSVKHIPAALVCFKDMIKFRLTGT